MSPYERSMGFSYYYNVVEGMYLDSATNEFNNAKIIIKDKMNVGLKSYIEENNITFLPIIITDRIEFWDEEELKLNALKYKIKEMSGIEMFNFVFSDILYRHMEILILIFLDIYFIYNWQTKLRFSNFELDKLAIPGFILFISFMILMYFLPGVFSFRKCIKLKKES